MMRIRRLLVDKLFGKNDTTKEQESLFSEITRADAVDQIYGDRDPQSRRAMLEVMKIIEMYVMNQLLTQSRGGDIKYSSAIWDRSCISWPPSMYITIYRYIALCISGQLEPGTVDFYGELAIIDNTQINYNTRLYTNSKADTTRLKSIIARCIVDILGHDKIKDYL